MARAARCERSKSGRHRARWPRGRDPSEHALTEGVPAQTQRAATTSRLRQHTSGGALLHGDAPRARPGRDDPLDRGGRVQAVRVRDPGHAARTLRRPRAHEVVAALHQRPGVRVGVADEGRLRRVATVGDLLAVGGRLAVWLAVGLRLALGPGRGEQAADRGAGDGGEVLALALADLVAGEPPRRARRRRS